MKETDFAKKIEKNELKFESSPRFERAVIIIFVLAVWLVSIIVMAQNNQRITTLEKLKKDEIGMITAIESARVKEKVDLNDRFKDVSCTRNRDALRIAELENTVKWMSEEMAKESFGPVKIKHKKKWLFW